MAPEGRDSGRSEVRRGPSDRGDVFREEKEVWDRKGVSEHNSQGRWVAERVARRREFCLPRGVGGTRTVGSGTVSPATEGPINL